MAHSNGYITAPIEVDDVAAICWVQLQRTVNGTLQTAYSYDVGTLCGKNIGDTVRGLDGNGNWTVVDRSEINKWARYKPVQYAKIPELTHAQRLSVKFGLNVPFVTDAGALMNDTVYSLLQAPSSATNIGWEYYKPTGGANSDYRLNDFVAKANDGTTTPWAGSLAGYNHNAPFPCTVNIDQSSGYVVSMGADTYEVNIQAVSSVKFKFTPATGSDLCIQDFLDWSLQDDTIKWRPLLQMFYPNGTTPWYQVSQPTATAGGTEITATRSTVLEVSVSTTGRVLNQYYHVCLGIACCDTSGTRLPAGETAQAKRLFIAPYDRSVRFTPQFYYRLRFVNYFTHAIKVVEVWYPYQGGYKRATESGGSQSFIVGSDILSGNLGIKMEITRTNLDAYFVKMYTSATQTPKMYIQAGEQIGSGTTSNKEFIPAPADNYGAETPYWYIQADSDYATRNPKLTMIAYAQMPHGITSNMTATATYHMQSQIESQGWVDVNTFSVRVSQT